jgi:ABC-type uncharacterized transport system permease subunit/ABC-type uncharacterized transport system substrate-binding protein
MPFLPLIFIFVCLLGCQSNQSNAPTIGFIDAFEDETLAQAKQGFFDALDKNGFSEKKGTLQIIYRNAQGDLPTLVQITDYMLAQKVKLLATNPTLATITALQKTSTLPVCMMVTGHPNLLGLMDSKGNAPANLLGVFETQAYFVTAVETAQQLMPKLKRLGVIYNQAEPQAADALKLLAQHCKILGMELESLPVSSSSETQLVVQALLQKKIDAFFALPDNVVFSSFEVIARTCREANVPIFTSEAGLVKRGAVCAYGADMYAWGYQAGEQASLFLRNPTKIPPLVKVQKYQKLYNETAGKPFNLKPDKTFQTLQTSAKQTNTSNSFQNVYLSALWLGLAYSALALGIFISMRIFDIPDITTDSSYTLGGAITATLLLLQIPLPIVLVASVLAGISAGMTTGFIHTSLRVNALLAGILVMNGLYSVNLLILGKANVPLIETQNLLYSFSPTLPDMWSQGIVLSGVALLCWGGLAYLLRTDFGLAMRATGSAEQMIRANGVNTNRMKMIGLGLSNGLTALSGFLLVQYQGFADINMGLGVMIVGLGSVIIGEAVGNFFKSNHIYLRLGVVILGTIIFRELLAIVLSLGVPTELLKLITSLFVLAIVVIGRRKPL